MSLVIRNARVRGYQQFVDIAIEGDLLSAIGPKLPTKAAKELDASGSLVLPGLFNLHFHADKCLLSEIMREKRQKFTPVRESSGESWITFEPSAILRG
jgi:cytosine/adenosine deaminase-related metal-dependent hydrolase